MRNSELRTKYSLLTGCTAEALALFMALIEEIERLESRVEYINPNEED